MKGLIFDMAALREEETNLFLCLLMFSCCAVSVVASFSCFESLVMWEILRAEEVSTIVSIRMEISREKGHTSDDWKSIVKSQTVELEWFFFCCIQGSVEIEKGGAMDSCTQRDLGGLRALESYKSARAEECRHFVSLVWDL